MIKREGKRSLLIKFREWLRFVFQQEMCRLGEGVFYINGADTLPSPLSETEEKEALRKAADGDQTARDALITHNLRLVVYIARKFESSGVGIEDLISIGTIGLIKAVGTFCPDKNIKLATYSSRCIENEILMFLRKTAQLKKELSIDEPLNVDWDGNELLLSDILGSDPDEVNRNIEQEAEKNVLLDCVSRLSEREQTIMRLRFGIGGEQEHTQKEVADLLGISQSYISRLEKKIIKRLRKEIEKAG
ncbi:MAG: RNA polymerase sporulation sigma factor SigE [Clostridia bacterium]|jgi:RNA polymerase sporulation-specific sigma factor|nr:RNA polymerase sporulation sigma factor SigE [Clostridia bacterium]